MTSRDQPSTKHVLHDGDGTAYVVRGVCMLNGENYLSVETRPLNSNVRSVAEFYTFANFRKLRLVKNKAYEDCIETIEKEAEVHQSKSPSVIDQIQDWFRSKSWFSVVGCCMGFCQSDDTSTEVKISDSAEVDCEAEWHVEPSWVWVAPCEQQEDIRHTVRHSTISTPRHNTSPVVTMSCENHSAHSGSADNLPLIKRSDSIDNSDNKPHYRDCELAKKYQEQNTKIICPEVVPATQDSSGQLSINQESELNEIHAEWMSEQLSELFKDMNTRYDVAEPEDQGPEDEKNFRPISDCLPPGYRAELGATDEESYVEEQKDRDQFMIWLSDMAPILNAIVAQRRLDEQKEKARSMKYPVHSSFPDATGILYFGKQAGHKLHNVVVLTRYSEVRLLHTVLTEEITKMKWYERDMADLMAVKSCWKWRSHVGIVHNEDDFRALQRGDYVPLKRCAPEVQDRAKLMKLHNSL